jgi:hypothetical protein
MKTAIVIMSILGCDDSATQCHYIETVNQRWASIDACDASSEARLNALSVLDYPMVVAVCETEPGGELAMVQPEPAPASTATNPEERPEAAGQLVPKVVVPMISTMDAMRAPNSGLGARVLRRFRSVLPDTADLQAVINRPVHVVSDGYSWVARRLKPSG